MVKNGKNTKIANFSSFDICRMAYLRHLSMVTYLKIPEPYEPSETITETQNPIENKEKINLIKHKKYNWCNYKQVQHLLDYLTLKGQKLGFKDT